MLNHPYFMLEQAKIHQEKLIADASHRRLLRLAREWRNACRAESAYREAAAYVADSVARTAPVAAAPVAALAGTLASCGRHVAGSAR